eukprot:CAMPEP_0177629840 /NCGR_PEP_ID=MMETSP0447-20121125/881_1 /TAXON_ID=0 /ORGANISM="Stygamoeba regulata, Strain BSH-02190019" /LENGTH=186 /DNA_ID=CAMNT_0019131185 /DNA_START=245 /DNA_END=801 /DNA_ORIENTATION=+
MANESRQWAQPNLYSRPANNNNRDVELRWLRQRLADVEAQLAAKKSMVRKLEADFQQALRALKTKQEQIEILRRGQARAELEFSRTFRALREENNRLSQFKPANLPGDGGTGPPLQQQWMLASSLPTGTIRRRGTSLDRKPTVSVAERANTSSAGGDVTSAVGDAGTRPPAISLTNSPAAAATTTT